jgi:hypothetical protein
MLNYAKMPEPRPQMIPLQMNPLCRLAVRLSVWQQRAVARKQPQ